MNRRVALGVLRELGLLDWWTVLVGLCRGWLDPRQAVEYASEHLDDGAAGSEDLILRLAVEHAHNGAAVKSLVAEIATRASHSRDPIDPDTLAAVEDVTCTTGNVRRAFDAWRLAFLEAVSRGDGPCEDMLDRLEEAWAEFGYPADMEMMSQYFSTPDERAGVVPFGNVGGRRSLQHMDHMIAALRQQLLAPAPDQQHSSG